MKQIDKIKFINQIINKIKIIKKYKNMNVLRKKKKIKTKQNMK